MDNEPNKPIAHELKKQATILGIFVGIFWLVEFFNQVLFHDRLEYYGIIPHKFIGLRGILFAPFIHANLAHLISNTIPFLILGWFVMLQETSDFFIVTAIAMLTGGVGVWLFAPSNTVHIGASGLIFGYLGFLLFRGIFQRNFPSIILSVIVTFLYGGLVWGVLPSPLRPYISWQGHLFGFLGGVLAAWLVAKEKKTFS